MTMVGACRWPRWAAKSTEASHPVDVESKEKSMDVLREGASGPGVEELQKKLQAVGFPPGAIDGQFGPGTEAAVVAFQQSHGLLADGVVGPRTASTLGFAEGDIPPPLPVPAFSVAMV